jgi:hypothetical protein
MDSRVIQIAGRARSRDSAEIDVAEIERFQQSDGRQKLVIYSTGKTGTIRYGKLVIEEGGQLSGEISLADTVTPAKPAAVPTRPELQAMPDHMPGPQPIGLAAYSAASSDTASGINC